MPTDASPARLRLLTIAVDAYDQDGDEDDGVNLGIQDQLRAVYAWWTDPDLGERRFSPEHPTALNDRNDIEAFLHSKSLREAPPDDVLVLYITGHGLKGTGGSHFLQLPATDTARLLTTAYRTSDLVLAVLDSHAAEVLVIVNSCHSGRILTELTQAGEEITLRRRRHAHLAVIATADAAETVAVRDMAILLDTVRDQLLTTAGITAPHLSVDEFIAELNRAADANGDTVLATPRSLLSWGAPRRLTRCLPNPGYRPADDVVAPARRQVAASRTEVDYWLSRASGRTDDTDPGWYFSGRATLNRPVTGFLDRPFPGAVIVTGAAGSGKSAVIARAVTLTDPDFRHHPHYQTALANAPDGTVPPVGSIDAAVLARNKTADRILADLITALGHQPVSTAGSASTVALRAQLRDTLLNSPPARGPGRPHTLVIDGFDEAIAPYTLVPELISPLAPLTNSDSGTGLRLVIGVRSTSPPVGGAAPASGLPALLASALAPHTEPLILRTDELQETAGSIAAYLHALLAESPGVDAKTTADIAGRTAPSFLDARIAAAQLRASPDPAALAADPQWAKLLQQGTVGLLRRDLAETATPDLPAATALAILRAAAFAPGAGIPWADIWPAVTQAVLGHDIPDPDTAITRLLESRLSGYLTQDTEDGRIVHRPLHERLTDVLRDHPEQLHTPPIPPPHPQ